MGACLHARVHDCTWVRVCMRVHDCTWVRVCMRVHDCTWVRVCMRVHDCTSVVSACVYMIVHGWCLHACA